MGKELCLRLLRRVCAAVLALLAAILISTPVMAEDGMPQTSPEPALTEQDFAAVAAQLEAVARGQGREIADQMLYASLRSVSPVAPRMEEAEVSAAPTSAPTQNAPAVVVHSAEKSTWSLSGLLPFFAVVAVAMTGMFAVFFSLRRRPWTGRRTAAARSRSFR